MPQETGILIEWNDERGYGFVRNAAGLRLFIHISDIAPMVNRPRIGDGVAFERGKGRDGRPAAKRAKITGANPVSRGAQLRGMPKQDLPQRAAVWTLPAIVAGLLSALVLLALVLGRLPLWLGGIYAFMSLVSFGAYGRDKALAQAGEWRISEANLHGLDLLGGIIGGLLGQQVFRHKTSKASFARLTSVIAALHVLALAALCLVPLL